MKRAFWALVGVGAGVTIGVVAVRWVGRTKQKLSPPNLARSAAGAGATFADKLRDAIEAGRQEMERKEAELRAELGLAGP